MRERTVMHATGPALDALPVFEPDRGLWPRIAAEAARRRRARRARIWVPSVAAAAAIAIMLATFVPRAPAPTEVASGMRESQRLESEWRALPPESTARSAAALARLHVIDSTLQAAYDRGAAADELKPLWKQRNDALRGLIQGTRTEAITQI